MHNCLVSIIIPVYNSEKYLKYCIESAINQSYHNIEIILINDGAKDNSEQICKEYADKDKRIKLLNQKNSGPATARNFGIMNSHGKFIMFLDSDDILHTDAIKYMLDIMLSKQSDIVVADYCCIKSHNNIEFINTKHDFDITEISKTEAWENLFNDKHMVFGTVWGVLFCSKIFENIRFPDGRTYEDTSIVHLLYNKSNKIFFVNKPLYYYFENLNSITHTISEKNIIDSVIASEERTFWFKKELGKSNNIYLKSVRLHLVHTMHCYRQLSREETKKMVLKSFDKIFDITLINKIDKDIIKECIRFRIKTIL